jgi:hypothetical protein
LDRLLVDIIERLRDNFADHGAETAHLKAIGMHEGYYAVANLISSFDPPQLSLPSASRTMHAEIVVNARVAISPEDLTTHVRRAILESAANSGASADITSLQSFRPGRPVPTHRINAG